MKNSKRFVPILLLLLILGSCVGTIVLRLPTDVFDNRPKLITQEDKDELYTLRRDVANIDINVLAHKLRDKLNPEDYSNITKILVNYVMMQEHTIKYYTRTKEWEAYNAEMEKLLETYYNEAQKIQ